MAKHTSVRNRIPVTTQANCAEMIDDVARHAREDVSKVSDPKAQALYETAAEVLNGLSRAFQHAEEKSEAAWK